MLLPSWSSLTSAREGRLDMSFVCGGCGKSTMELVVKNKAVRPSLSNSEHTIGKQCPVTSSISLSPCFVCLKPILTSIAGHSNGRQCWSLFKRLLLSEVSQEFDDHGIGDWATFDYDESKERVVLASSYERVLVLEIWWVVRPLSANVHQKKNPSDSAHKNVTS